MKHTSYSSFQLAGKYLQYWFKADNGKGHGIHSPFVYALIRDVLNDRGEYYAYAKIESLRARMERDKTPIEVLDLGAGKKGVHQSTIQEITKRTSKSQKLGRLLFRLSNYFQPSVILELGTSVGISSAYLFAGNTNASLFTLEGAPAIASVAMAHFEQLEFDRISTIIGNFDSTLEPLLNQLQQVDLVYIDGNHRFEPTVRYFQQLLPKVQDGTVLIFDDIHWSEEMEAAWEEIKQHPATRCTIDLFFIGLVFFSGSFKHPQHFTIRF